MEGAALAAERQYDRDMLIAHHGAAWTGAAFAGKLKSFREYRPLPAGRAPKQSAEQLLESFMAMQEAGAPITIRKVN